eukprot:1073998-Amphidinium_carterae.1
MLATVRGTSISCCRSLHDSVCAVENRMLVFWKKLALQIAALPRMQAEEEAARKRKRRSGIGSTLRDGFLKVEVANGPEVLASRVAAGLKT